MHIYIASPASTIFVPPIYIYVVPLPYTHIPGYATDWHTVQKQDSDIQFIINKVIAKIIPYASVRNGNKVVNTSFNMKTNCLCIKVIN